MTFRRSQSKNNLMVASKLSLLSASIAATASPVTQAEEPRFALEEVVVTAQKREQNVMDVPIAIDNFSAKDIENTGALLLEDIADFIPGFEAGGGLTQSSLTIRGVSSANISSGGDASVATFYDGVYLPRSATTIAFSDMARVEVLKGPQGTLSGRNAAAGSVNIVPNRPKLDQQEGFIKLKAGNHSFQRWEGMINQPLSESLALRANLMLNKRDGYINNVAAAGVDIDSKDTLTGRVALLWQLSEDTSLQINADWDDSDNGPAPSVGYSQFAHNLEPTSGVVANDVINGQETRDMYSTGFRLEHDINEDWSMAWWANYRDLETTNRQDEDGTGLSNRYLDTDNLETSELLYSELQFNFSNDRIKYVGGITFSSEDKTQTTQINTNADTGATLATQVANGLLAAAGAGFSIDSIWSPTGWAQFSGVVNQLAGGALGSLDQSPASYNAVLGTLYASPFVAQIQQYNPVLAAGFVAPSYAGQLFTEEVSNTGEFVNWGIYSDVDFSVTEDLNVIVGLRYSKDKKDFSWFNGTAPLASRLNQERALLAQNGLPVAALIPQATNFLSPLSQQGVGLVTDRKVTASDSWSKTTGRAIAQYQISEKVMTFLSYSTGYTSGGFDSFVVNTAQKPLDPEEVSSVEWGIKADWLDNRLRTRLNIFDMEFENRQVSVFSADPNIPGFSAPIIIAGDEDITGWELALQWLPTDNIQLGMVTTSRDNERRFQRYIDANGNPKGGQPEKVKSLDEYTFMADWVIDLETGGELALHMDYVYKEQEYNENDPGYLPQYEVIKNFGDDRKLLNARIAWTSAEGNMTVALWGQNLLDNRYTSIPGGLAASSLATPTVSLTDPRTYGLDLEYRF